jgi:spermidine synthase
MMRFSSLAVVFFLLFFPASAQRGELLWSEDTDWGQVRVRQQGHERTLLFADQQGETEESRIDVRAPHRPVQRYLRQMLAATALWESQGESAWPPDGPSKPLKFLVVGLGGGSLSNALCHLFPEATVVSVDIEPAVVEAARRYFFLREDERSRVVIEDARRLLESSPESYDIIYLDAFDGLEVPAPLRTVEFAQPACATSAPCWKPCHSSVCSPGWLKGPASSPDSRCS